MEFGKMIKIVSASMVFMVTNAPIKMIVIF